jgi:transcriptional regulator with XRE-family HTH domain
MINKEDVLKLRYEGHFTYQEIGDMLGVSRQRIEQILNKRKNVPAFRRKALMLGGCSGCDARKGLTLYFLDGDRTNIKIENLIATCTECRKIFRKMTKDVHNRGRVPSRGLAFKEKKEYKCMRCGNTFFSFRTNQKYCSLKCAYESRSYHFTIEEIRRKNNERTKAYYQKNKNNPHYIAKQKQYNAKSMKKLTASGYFVRKSKEYYQKLKNDPIRYEVHLAKARKSNKASYEKNKLARQESSRKYYEKNKDIIQRNAKHRYDLKKLSSNKCIYSHCRKEICKDVCDEYCIDHHYSVCKLTP